MKYHLSLWVLFINLFLCTQSFAMGVMTNNTQRAMQSCQCPHCDLSQANLSQFSAGNIKLGDASSKPQACSVQCDFNHANMTQVNLSGVEFVQCLRGYVTPIKSASFSHANLSKANLSGSTFYGVDFNHANLSQSNLRKASLSLCDFTRVNFQGANLQQSVSQRDAMHGWGSNFSHANFSQANLQGAKLYGYFVGANFRGANLSHASLSTGVDAVPAEQQSNNNPKLWQGVNFTNANLTGAKFIFTKNAKSISDIEKSSAILCHTTMPNGNVNNRDCE